METKYLGLQGTAGKTDTTYAIKMKVPQRSDLLTELNQFPHHIQSEQEITFSTGPLAYAQHSICVFLICDCNNPQVRIYIKLQPNKGDLIIVADVKGKFEVEPTNENREMNSPSSEFSFSRGSEHDWLNYKYNDLKEYVYWESSCNWPYFASELSVHVRVTEFSYCKIVSDNAIEIPKKLNQLNGMIDAKPFFLNESCSDVTIIAGDSETQFHAHKVILSSKSRFFATMFNTPMREAKEGKVNMKDVDGTLMTEVLRFIYLDEIQDMEKSAADLLVLSDKYEIDEMKQLCIQHLVQHVSVDNATEMYDLSMSIGGGEQLKDKAKQIIMWNRVNFSANSETFTLFTTKYPELILELLRME